jgi:hypothetical protein
MGDDIVQLVGDPGTLFRCSPLLGRGDLLAHPAIPPRAKPVEERVHEVTVTRVSFRCVIPAYEQEVIPTDDAGSA